MKVRKNKLTPKERKYLRLRAESGFKNGTKAACVRAAGFAEGTTAAMIENRPRVRKLLEYEMNRQKFTLEKIVKTHVRLLDCNHPFRPEQPDNTVQMQAVREGYRIHDAYAPTQLNIDKTERRYNVSIEAYQRAEEITGEKIITIIPEEEKEQRSPKVEAL